MISLEATEVESKPVTREPPVDAPMRAASSEPSPAKPEEAPPPTQAAPEARSVDPPPQEPPPEPPSGSPSEPPSRRGPLAWLPEELTWAEASAGIAGVAGGLLVFLLLWLVGAFSGGERSADVTPRLAAIEKQLRAIATRPEPATVEPKAFDDLAERVASLARAQAAPRTPVTDPVVLGRIGAAEQALKSLSDNAASLSRRSDSADGAIRDIQARLDKMSAALTELQATARAASVGSDRAVRLAVAATALRTAVERGAPFAAELALVKPLASNMSALAPLEPFAAGGMPSNVQLARELASIVRPMLSKAGVPPSDAGFLERLQANAEKLVRIRPVDETRGDDRRAALARIAKRATDGNLVGAQAEIAKLPPSARAPFQPWIAKVAARDQAAEASRRFAAGAIAALKAAP